MKNGYTKCNLYDYVKQSPIIGIDSLGLELYAIDGTSFTEKNNGNVLLFKQRYKHGKAFYWDGPQNRVTGSDSGEISITVYDFICKRFCLNRRRKIDIIGWSRGAAIAIDVVNRLATHGCTCCGKSYKPQIHWLGLLDPVDMSIIWNGNSLKVNSIPSNVQQGVAIYAEDRGIKQTYDLLCFIPIFPESAQQIDMYLAKGASHNDVGGTGEQDPKINKEVLNFITQHIDNSYSK